MFWTLVEITNAYQQIMGGVRLVPCKKISTESVNIESLKNLAPFKISNLNFEVFQKEKGETGTFVTIHQWSRRSQDVHKFAVEQSAYEDTLQDTSTLSCRQYLDLYFSKEIVLV